jgi:hypothetical protein
MQLTLAAWFVPITLLMAGLVATRFRLNRRLREFGELRRVQAEDLMPGAVGETT